MKLRKPPKGRVWLHIDRIDKRNQRIWAVQSWDGDKALYQTAKAVIIRVNGYTQQWRDGQPRAVVEFPDAVVKIGGYTICLEPAKVGVIRVQVNLKGVSDGVKRSCQRSNPK